MPDVLELIKERRSIRKYSGRYVEWELVSRVLEAGRHAPSCGNLQNWRVVVVLEESLREKIAEACVQQYWMAEAPVHLVICAEPEKAERYYGVRGERLYAIQNCAAMAENMLVEAHSLGLGSCWVGAFDEGMVRRALGIPEEIRPQIILTLGYAAEKPVKPPKYPLESVVYFNAWRNRIRDPAAYFREYALIWRRGFEKGKEMLKETGENVKGKIKEKVLEGVKKRVVKKS